MKDDTPSLREIRHSDVLADGIKVHVAEMGSSEKLDVVLVHGWPQSWTAFAQAMIFLGTVVHVLALDLPGIGGSLTDSGR